MGHIEDMRHTKTCHDGHLLTKCSIGRKKERHGSPILHQRMIQYVEDPGWDKSGIIGQDRPQRRHGIEHD